ncbi:MAG: KH domain-containing protein [Coriobacteriales bacterium]|jgi:predicted RNA-binding protein YlqC (UPF0109 family)|nr:KH domain-containing protein [Coriobacteriales bacterium]
MAAEDTNIVALVETLVTELVDEPDAVQVAAREEGDSLVVEIQVAPDDVGKVIGRQGRIIKSIRTLARAASTYYGDRPVEVEVVG